MIPNNIILVWCAPLSLKQEIPVYLIENVKKKNPDKEILVFKDKEIEEFFLKYYEKKFLIFFNKLKFGRYKADFFRYCYLFKKGGYYMDIDSEPIIPIKDILESNVDFFTVVAKNMPGHIYQALIFTVPNNPIIKKCIIDMFRYGPDVGINPPDIPPYHGHPTKCMYDNIHDFLDQVPSKGLFIKNNLKIQLAEEVKSDGRHVTIYNSKKFAYSRYNNYCRDNGFKKTND